MYIYVYIATAYCEVATKHWTEGPKCFDRIAKELESIMKRKGYKSLDEFRGKLKDLNSKRE